jgi:hypothetical protein
MNFVTTVLVLTVALSATSAYSQTSEGVCGRDAPDMQAPSSSGETTGSATRPPSEIGPSNIVPADGATDRAPPSKLSPGELPTPQNSKAH